LEDKLYGAISDNISDPEKLARARFNANDLTENEDHIKIGRVTVFEDVTKGLGAAVKSKARMGYAEEEAAKQAKMQSKMASVKAQQQLQDIVKNNFGSGFVISGKQYSPITEKGGLHPDVAANLNQALGGSYRDQMGSPEQQTKVLGLLKKFIVRNPVQNRASGGSIASLTDIPWMATGGATSGTDTVPAMLTPGEFVINKKSADAIGYSNLSRMNAIGKYANGGPVGVQYLSPGGRLNAAFPLPSTSYGNKVGAAGNIPSSSAANQAVATVAQSANGLSKATNKMIVDVSKTSQSFENIANKGGVVSTSFALVGGALTSFAGQLLETDKAAAAFVSGFGASFATFQVLSEQLASIPKNIIGDSLSQKYNKKKQAVTDDPNLSKKEKKAAISQIANDESKSMARFAKGVAIADGAMLGFSTAMALGNAQVQYFAEKAKIAGDQLKTTIDKLKEDSKSITPAMLEKQYSNVFTSTTKASTLSNAINSEKGMTSIASKAGAGALAGGLALGPLGAAIGGVVGGMTGLGQAIAQGTADFDKVKGVVSSVSKSFATSMYTSIVALGKFNKFIGDIDKKSTKEVQDFSSKMIGAYVESNAELVNAQLTLINALGDSGSQSEAFKDQLNITRNSVDDLGKAIGQLNANIFSRASKEVAMNAASGENSVGNINRATARFTGIKNANKPEENTFGNDDLVEAQVRAKYEPLLAQARRDMAKLALQGRDPKKGGKLMPTEADVTAELKANPNDYKDGTLRNAIYGGNAVDPKDSLVGKQQNLDELNFRKSLTEVELQALKQARAMEVERQSREEIIGSLHKQLALQVGIENFTMSLTRVADKVTAIDAAFSNTVSGLQSAIPNIKVLDLLKPVGPNLLAFNQALKKIRELTPANAGANGGNDIGGMMANNLGDVKSVSVGLKSMLENASMDKEFDPNKMVTTLLGTNANGVVGKALKDIIARTLKPQEGDVNTEQTSLKTDAGRQKVIEAFEKFASELTEKSKSIIQALTEQEQQQRAILDKINESRQKQLDLQLEEVSSYERYISAIASARGKELSLAEKNAFRFEKQARLVGKLAGDTDAIGQQLLSARRGQLGSKDPMAQRGFTEAASRSEQALKALANQADRTSDTLSEINKIKAQREGIRDFAKEFATGTAEERQNIEKSIQSAMKVASAGSFDAVAEDQRKSADSVFEKFKDLPIFNGMTGRQAQNKAIAGSIRAAGGNEQVAKMIEQDTSSPEEKLIDELRRIYEEESKAREYLSAQENIRQDALVSALQENVMATQQLTATLQNEFKNMQANQAAGGFKPIDLTKIDQVITDATTRLADYNAQIKKASEALNSQIDAIMKAFPTPPAGFLDTIVETLLTAVNDVSTALTQLEQKIQQFITNPWNMFGGNAAAQPANQGVKPDPGFKPNGGMGGNWKPPAGGIGAPMGRATGGIIYRAKGGDINSHPGGPRGTDTVPAWLTEGEFVVNARDTKKNRTLLEKINSGNSQSEPEYHADGGAVGYYQMGTSGAGAGRNNPSPIADQRARARFKREERQVSEFLNRRDRREAREQERNSSPFNRAMGNARDDARRTGDLRGLSALGGTLSINPNTGKFEEGGEYKRNPKIEADLIAREMTLRKKIKAIYDPTNKLSYEDTAVKVGNMVAKFDDEFRLKAESAKASKDFSGAKEIQRQRDLYVKLNSMKSFVTETDENGVERITKGIDGVPINIDQARQRLQEREAYVATVKKDMDATNARNKKKTDEALKKKSPLDEIKRTQAERQAKADKLVESTMQDADKTENLGTLGTMGGLKPSEDSNAMLAALYKQLGEKKSEPYYAYGHEDKQLWQTEVNALQAKIDDLLLKQAQESVAESKKNKEEAAKRPSARERRLAEEAALKNKPRDQMTEEEKVNADLKDSINKQDADNAARWKKENEEADKNREVVPEGFYNAVLSWAYGDGERSAGFEKGKQLESYYGLNTDLEKYVPGVYSDNYITKMELNLSLKEIQKRLRAKDLTPEQKIQLDKDYDNIGEARYKSVLAAKEWIDKHKEEAPQNKASGGIVYRADGGSIFKPKGTDTVPAMLTPGEFVVKKSAVDAIGVDTLSAINSGQGFAAGGQVGYYQMGGQVDNSVEGIPAKGTQVDRDKALIRGMIINKMQNFLTNKDVEKTAETEAITWDEMGILKRDHLDLDTWLYDELKQAGFDIGEFQGFSAYAATRSNKNGVLGFTGPVKAAKAIFEKLQQQYLELPSPDGTVVDIAAISDRIAAGQGGNANQAKPNNRRAKPNDTGGNLGGTTDEYKNSIRDYLLSISEDKKITNDENAKLKKMADGLRKVEPNFKLSKDSITEAAYQKYLEALNNPANGNANANAGASKDLKARANYLMDIAMQNGRDNGAITQNQKNAIQQVADKIRQTEPNFTLSSDPVTKDTHSAFKKMIEELFRSQQNDTAKKGASFKKNAYANAFSAIDDYKITQREYNSIDRMIRAAQKEDPSFDFYNPRMQDFGDQTPRYKDTADQLKRLWQNQSGKPFYFPNNQTDRNAGYVYDSASGKWVRGKYAQDRDNNPRNAGDTTVRGLDEANERDYKIARETGAYSAEQLLALRQRMLEEQGGGRPAYLHAAGGMIYRAGGGSIFKPKGTDTVPAMLTPGEFVMKKSAVDKHGLDFMNQLNSGGPVEYRAAGGGGNREQIIAANKALMQRRLQMNQNVQNGMNPAQAAMGMLNQNNQNQNQNQDNGAGDLKAQFDEFKKALPVAQLEKFAQILDTLEQAIGNLGGEFVTVTQEFGPFMDNMGRMVQGMKTTTITKVPQGDALQQMGIGNGQQQMQGGMNNAIPLLQREVNILSQMLEIMMNGGANMFAGGGTVKGFAGGGDVGNIFKPKGTDTVPAMLSEGEFVIRKSAVDKVGTDTLHAINRGVGGYVSYLADGGIPGIGLSAPGGKGYWTYNPQNLKEGKKDKSFWGKLGTNSNNLGGMSGLTGFDKTFYQKATNPFYDMMSDDSYFGRSTAFGGSQFGQGQGMSPLGGLTSVKYNAKGGFQRSLPGAIDRRKKEDPAAAMGGLPTSDPYNMGTVAAPATDYAFGVGIGPQGGSGLSYNDDYSDISKFLNPYGMQNNGYGNGIQTGEVSLDQMYQNMANQKLMTGDNTYSPMGNLINYTPGQSPSEIGNSMMQQYMYGPEARMRRYIDMMSNSLSQRYMNNISSFWNPQQPEQKEPEKKATGGLIYLAKGGNLNPNLYKNETTYDKLFGKMYGNSGIQTGEVSLEQMYQNMANQKLMNGDNSYTSMGNVVNYAPGQSPSEVGNAMMQKYMYGPSNRMQQSNSKMQQMLLRRHFSQMFNFWNNRMGNGNQGQGQGNGGNQNQGGGMMGGAGGGGMGGGMGGNAGGGMFASGGLVSYLRGGGIPAANKIKVGPAAPPPMSGSFGVGGFGNINSMIPGANKPKGSNSTMSDPFLMGQNNLFKGESGNWLKNLSGFGRGQNSNNLMKLDSFRSIFAKKQQGAGTSGFSGFNNLLGQGAQAIGRYANGGGVDTIPAMLTPGEFVMTKEAVEKHGVGFMNQLNQGGKIKGYAKGGVVYRAGGGSSDSGGGGSTTSTVDINVDLASISNAIASSIKGAFSSIPDIINVDALNTLAGTFSNLAGRFDGLAGALSNMQMTHNVNVTGTVSVAGLDNVKRIAEAITDTVTDLVVNTVKQITGSRGVKNNASNMDTMS
jgi:hypothetical protein